MLFLSFVILFFSCKKIETKGVLVPPTVDQDSNLPQVQINVSGVNRKIHVLKYGSISNPVLFLIHGSYTDIRAYQNICEGLSDKYYVILWDQRGCGLSERITEDEFTFDTAVEEINKMKEVYSPNNQVTIVGHSWGGGLAGLYASKNPEKIRQLILLEPMPLRGSDMDKIWKTLIEFDFFNDSWNDFARQAQAITANNHEQLDYRAQMMLKNTMTRYHCNNQNPPEWPIWRIGGFMEFIRNKRLGNPNAGGFKYDFTSGLETYTDSVLIVGGSCSSLGYDMQLKYNKSVFKNSIVKEIPNAGHRMNMEQYSYLINTLKEFLYEY